MPTPLPLVDLSNKLAVITGAGSGIGAASAATFAALGARVAVIECNEESGESTVTAINNKGGDASNFTVDVADYEAVREGFSRITADLGVPDILINNAGIAHIGTLEETSLEDFELLYNVNVRGVYNCMHAIIGPMVEHGGGVILNVASVVAKVAIPDRFAYSMSKGAVFAMTLSVARDYIDKNIRCNCLCPARVHTPFIDNYLKKNYPGSEEQMFRKLRDALPIGRMARPGEIADLAAYLCSDTAAFITGSAVDIDGGFTLLR